MWKNKSSFESKRTFGLKSFEYESLRGELFQKFPSQKKLEIYFSKLFLVIIGCIYKKQK